MELLKRRNLAEDRRLLYTDAMSETTTRAATLTSQLLAFPGRQALKPEVFDVAQSIRTLGEMVITLTGSRVRVDAQVPDRLFFVNDDASHYRPDQDG